MRQLDGALLTAVAMTTVLAGVTTVAADREVAWVVLNGGPRAERDLNQHASRGLRLATVTDGLECPVAVMQAPEPRASEPASYRVVADRDLATELPSLADHGFEPRGRVRWLGGRAHVIWERAPVPRDARFTAWRIVEFSSPDTLEADLAAAARDGFEPRLLARLALRSWPGLSEKGLLLAGQRANAAPREIRVVKVTGRKVDDEAREIEGLASSGWTLDVAFTTSRDGSRDARRERAYFVFSRPTSGAGQGAPLTLVRSTSWGMVGSGQPVFGAPYWDGFLFVYRPDERRQMWASPTRLPKQSGCAGIGFDLRLEGGREQRSTISGAIAREAAPDGQVELVLLLEERLGR